MADFYARYDGLFGGGGGGGGSGDVVGPSSATDNAIARFDGTTGKLIQNSNAILDDSGNVGFQGTVVAGQLIDSGLTASTVPYADASKQFTSSAVTPTQLGFLSGASGTTGSNNLVFSSAPTLANPIVGTQTQGDASTKAASTAYVDTAITNAIAGVNPAVAVQAATTAAGDTSGLTYNNGASGIGATFTGSTNTALTIDGFTFTAVGQRLLVKNDTQSPSGAFNGIYSVTQIQTAILPPILTRALDYNTPSDMNNTGAIPVVNGTVNGTTSWVLTSQVVTVGTTPLTFTKFSINPSTIVTAVSVASANGLAGSSSGGTTPALTLSTSVTGILSGNGTAISAATTTGSGSVVLATSPTLVTPALGTPTSGVLTSCTGLPIAGGGTGQATKAAAFDALSPMSASGDIIYGGTSGTGTRLAKGSDGQVLALSSGLPVWSSAGAVPTLTTTVTFSMTITGSTSNPTRGTVASEVATWSRVGDKMKIHFDYRQTAAGSAGSGTYLFLIPNSNAANTSFVGTLGSAPDGWVAVGAGSVSLNTDGIGGSSSSPCVVYLYDSTHMFLAFQPSDGTNYIVPMTAVGSSQKSFSNTNLIFTFNAEIPISGWTAFN